MRFQLQLLLIEVHYSDEICGVYNGYLKSGSKQKLEKQRANLERESNCRGRKKKEGAYAWLIGAQSSAKFFAYGILALEKKDAIFWCVYA
jgi:hypothetical protein